LSGSAFRLPILLRSLWSEVRHPGFWGRALPLLALYGLGAWLLTSVPTTAGHPLPWAYALYHSLRFFTLDGYGFPTSPTPGLNALFWVVLLGAPALTASALLDAFLFLRRQLMSPALRVQRMRAPAVVCGYGSHGRVLVDLLVEAGWEVVVVDLGVPDTIDMLRVRDQLVPVVRGDMVAPETLRQAGVDRARMVWFSAGDPIVNLKAALVARDHLPGAPDRRLIPMVDEDELATVILRCFGGHGIEPFPQFEAAAEALVGTAGVQEALADQCRKSQEARVAIVGFGRFGRAVARALLPLLCDLQGAGEQAPHILEVIDRHATSRADELVPTLEAAGWRLEVGQCDAEDWATRVRREPPRLAFFCMDNDVLNLRCAARLLAVGQPVSVVLRLFNPPREGASPGPATISTWSVAALLRENIRAHFGGSDERASRNGAEERNGPEPVGDAAGRPAPRGADSTPANAPD
jgi:voltage-gated potassium channel Kch